jgi:hypothetical protein
VNSANNSFNSLFSASVGNGSSNVAAAFDNGNVGIGTRAPVSKLDIAGGVSVGSYAGNNAAPSNGMIISGNIGIGTTNPTVPLYISHNGPSGTLGENITVIQTQPNSTDMQDSAFNLFQSLTASSTTNELITRVFSLNAANNLTGGGTLQNQRVFDLVANSNANTTTTNAAAIYLESNTTAGTVGTAYGMYINPNFFSNATNRYGIYDPTGAEEYFSGNVGIGTTAPATTLQVVGTSSSTIRIGASTLPGCLEMGNSNGIAGINYITALNGVLTATTTKPSSCQ